MVHPSSTSLLEIVLDAPHVTIPEQTSRGVTQQNSCGIDGSRAVLSGHLIVRTAKAMRIRSLYLILTGAAHTSFPLVLPLSPATHGKTLKKTPSATDSHYQHSFKFLTHTWPFYESKAKTVYTLEPGEHSFPFSVNIDPSLPCTFTTSTTAVHYQLTAFLQPASIISFVQGNRISLPVIVLPAHNQALLDATPGMETSGYMRLEASSSVPEPQERITGEAHFPCKIFTQTGVIPVSMSLTLVGEGTILTKLSVELWEAVYRLDDQGDADGNRKPLDMRLCSRQNCPLSADWRPSTLDAPSFISKRLLFKVPDMPVSTWSKNKDGYTAIPGRGVCHTSGEYLCSKIKIEHTFKLILEYQYEVVVEESAPKNGRRSNTGGSNHPDEVVVIRDGVVEAEERVMIVSHLDSTNGHDAEPPCYYRSFTSVPVNPSHIPYIDAAIAHALHDDPHAYPHDEYGHSTSEAIGSRLPDYEECIESVTDSSGGSSRVNSIRSVSSASMRDATSFNSSTSSLGQFGAAPETDVGQGTASPPQSPSSESHQLLDLTSYIERYSRGELPV